MFNFIFLKKIVPREILQHSTHSSNLSPKKTHSRNEFHLSLSLSLSLIISNSLSRYYFHLNILNFHFISHQLYFAFLFYQQNGIVKFRMFARGFYLFIFGIMLIYLSFIFYQILLVTALKNFLVPPLPFRALFCTLAK